MRGGRRWGCPEPVQVQTCDVGFPRRLRRGSPAFFGRKPEERTPGRREVLSALDPPLSGWWPERGFLFLQNWPAAHSSYARNGPPTGWAGWERQEFWDPLRWAPKIGGCTPNRASEAGTLGVSSVFCPAHGPGHPLLAFGQFTLGPCKKQITFHSGPCEGRKSATLLSYPNLLPQNANPNQGTQMGTVIAPPPKQCGTTAKTSEWERAGHKKGGRGSSPATLCVRAFS